MLFPTLSIDFENAERLRVIDRGLLKVTGAAAEKFLQGQLTCDVSIVHNNAGDTISERMDCLGAHCNVKGRVVFTFRLFYSHDSYFLSLPKNQVECAMQSLKKYAVFSKVSIEDVSDTVSSAALTALNPQQKTTDFEHWKLMDIESGIAEIYPETREQFTPHELNYHQLNAVSFDKGCYIGQEIVARMHYLGKLKTQLMLADFFSEIAPQRGEKVFYGENQLGGYLVDFALQNEHQYKLLVSLYTQARHEVLWNSYNKVITVPY